MTLQWMLFHRDSLLECQSFFLVFPWLFVVNVCLDSQNSTYNKGKREQTLSICFLFHSVLRLWATYIPFVSGVGDNGILRGVWPWKFLGAEFHMEHTFKSCQRKQWITLCVQSFTWQVVNTHSHSPFGFGCVATLSSHWKTFCLGLCLKDPWSRCGCLFLIHTLC